MCDMYWGFTHTMRILRFALTIVSWNSPVCPLFQKYETYRTHKIINSSIQKINITLPHILSLILESIPYRNSPAFTAPPPPPQLSMVPNVWPQYDGCVGKSRSRPIKKHKQKQITLAFPLQWAFPSPRSMGMRGPILPSPPFKRLYCIWSLIGE